MSTDDQGSVWSNGSRRVLVSMELDELAALAEVLDRRVRAGTATLEDFGSLDRTRQELARRAADGRSA